MKPYKRIKRKHKNGDYGYAEIFDLRYCTERVQLLNAYRIIEKDFRQLFEFIEPCQENHNTFSHRIYELFLRTCTEVETNFKGILLDNGYTKRPKDFFIGDYFKVNEVSKLFEYEVRFHAWKDGPRLLRPFSIWSFPNISLPWYKAYNEVKHDRSRNFALANLENLTNAIAGLFVLLASQFGSQVFYSHQYNITNYSMEDFYFDGDSLFSFKFPDSWTNDELYDYFDENDVEPFQNFDFNT